MVMGSAGWFLDRSCKAKSFAVKRNALLGQQGEEGETLKKPRKIEHYSEAPPPAFFSPHGRGKQMSHAQDGDFFAAITRNPKRNTMRIFVVIRERWRLDICRGDSDCVQAFPGGDSQLLVSTQGNYV